MRNSNTVCVHMMSAVVSYQRVGIEGNLALIVACHDLFVYDFLPLIPPTRRSDSQICHALIIDAAIVHALFAG